MVRQNVQLILTGRLTCNGKSKVVTIIAICGFLVLRKHVRKITVEDVSVNPQDLLLVYYYNLSQFFYY